ncbi:hypothetical protein COT97_01615 [Candidatus Falkowbacteria bacterium CG10_big_fil_rev_8_21_14_0_10_39_11]|uniref:Gcp-like domain-containing protein n=1 Tax=Candidatus Falkowbacteria bacterium CG10_big_fil_rev_8_21_14_0_10_39_11 TaxID=1974565 RepID=A0A2H0V5K6_9BACT|nr:MAG: hypothetical protein COT97_01615 [Candidatus Falkowbacteria bacterium CG10_big_fil_rev_8_21_14_0_10_39_11]
MNLVIATENNKYFAVGLGGRKLQSFEILEERYQQSERLLDEIEKIIKKDKNELSDLGRIIVVIGPGDFSALRIGVATANALAYSLGIEVVGVRLNTWWLYLSYEQRLKKVWKVGLRQAQADTSKVKWVEPEYGREPNIG